MELGEGKNGIVRRIWEDGGGEIMVRIYCTEKNIFNKKFSPKKTELFPNILSNLLWKP